MKPYLPWLCVLVLAAGCFLAWRELSLGGSGEVRAYFFDVGQGDGQLLVSPTGRQIVIDGGPDLSMLHHLGRTLPFFDRTIDLLVLTHPHADHMTALPAILERYQVKAILLTGVSYHSTLYADFLAAVRAEHGQVIIADPAKDIDMGDGLLLDVVSPPPVFTGKEVEEVNDTSVVLRAMFASGSILFTGDMERAQEASVLGSGVDIDADILKVGHHGSDSSSSTGLLLDVSPELAIMSAGRGNSYGHPDPMILSRYAALKIPVMVTMDDGTICVVLPKRGRWRLC